jgi:hypothetical protein
MGAHTLEVCIRPDGPVQRTASPLYGEMPELPIAGITEPYRPPFAAGPGDRAGACECLNTGRRGKSLTIIAELGQQGRCKQISGSWERVKDRMVRVLPEQISLFPQSDLFGVHQSPE